MDWTAERTMALDRVLSKAFEVWCIARAADRVLGADWSALAAAVGVCVVGLELVRVFKPER